MDNKKRIAAIDIARGIAILLVIIAHTNLVKGVTYKLIFSFHVPVFFVISGFCFKKKPFGQFLVSRSKRLLLPYTVYSLVFLFVDCFIGLINGWNNIAGQILQIITGRNDILWFIVTLFVSEVVFYIVVSTPKLYQKLIITFCCVAVGLIMMRFNIDYYYHIDTALIMIPFLLIGYVMRERRVLQYFSAHYRTAWLVLFSVITIIVALINECVNVRVNGFGIIPLFYVAAMCGSVALILLSSYIEKVKVLSITGQNTLDLYALNTWLPTKLQHIGWIFANGIVRKATVVAILIFVAVWNEYLSKKITAKIHKPQTRDV